MYRCQSCQKSVGPGVPCHRVTVASRLTQFPARPTCQRAIENGRRKWKDDPGGTGPQIVRELQMCAACAATRSGAQVVVLQGERQTRVREKDSDMRWRKT
ncbi:hypothetical protein GCM10012319_33670 [Comamonas sp. KCTC 72670]|nr:hypothetical protein GCM10012319_33670 [Comamonas sp. KCTC 72670]